MQKRFSVDELFAIAESDMPKLAGELILGVYSLHRRACIVAHDSIQSYAEDRQVLYAVRHGIKMAQLRNYTRLEQRLSGLTLKVEAYPEAVGKAIAHNGDGSLREAVGDITAAYPFSFTGIVSRQSFTLYDLNERYVVHPLDAQGFPQVAIQPKA